MIKVLVVDATKVTERLAKDTLVPLGCQIITATSTALGVFLARKNFPSLIINGVNGFNDVELPQEILTDPELAHIPVVVVATGKQKAAVTAPLSGAVKMLAHPLTPERFFEELRPYLLDLDDGRPPETSE